MKYLFILSILLVSCSKPEVKKEVVINSVKPIALNLKQANNLATLPLHCIETEYPNKLSQVIGDKSYLKEPKELHPSFYGCFDWHSAVHGHWSLVTLLKQFPDLAERKNALEKLNRTITKENVLNEIKYFDDTYNKNYERMYGWAWLLKLAQELHTWDSKEARILESNLQPLTDLIVGKYIEFLPKLNYPIRVGTHTNTAFGVNFAYDYAKTVGNKELVQLIEKRAKDFFYQDANCPIEWEPSGYDFLSPCLQEATLMKRVLTPSDYKDWLQKFLPQLFDKNYDLAVGEVSDRTDGHLVHLDGVNFSRAWCFYEISKDIPELNHLQNVAQKHLQYSLPNLVGDSYEGGHWLASFAIYALQSQ